MAYDEEFQKHTHILEEKCHIWFMLKYFILFFITTSMEMIKRRERHTHTSPPELTSHHEHFISHDFCNFHLLTRLIYL